MKQVKVGEIEIPFDYFKFKPKEKEALCQEILDAILHVLDRQLNPNIDRMIILDKLLESSIITNQDEENYEICAVLLDIRNLINE